MNEKLSKRAKMLFQLANNNIVHMTFILDDAEIKDFVAKHQPLTVQ